MNPQLKEIYIDVLRDGGQISILKQAGNWFYVVTEFHAWQRWGKSRLVRRIIDASHSYLLEPHD